MNEAKKIAVLFRPGIIVTSSNLIEKRDGKVW